jgi:hypothetical protein
MNTPVEDDLRATLARHAGTVPVRSDPYDLVTERVAIDRRRRIVAAAITTALVIIAGVLSTPMVSKLSSPEFAPASLPADWPVRGELAKDPGVVPFIEKNYKGRVEDVHLLYAGDIGGRRYVLFRIDDDPDRLRILAAPAGSFAGQPDGGELAIPSQMPNAVSFVDRGSTGARSMVFLMGAPGIDFAQYSTAPIVGPDGKVTRRWERLERKADGVFVGTVDSQPPSEVYRVRFVVDKSVRADVRPANLTAKPLSVTSRVAELAKNVTDVQDVHRLNLILQRVEDYYVGPGAIAMVGARWREPDSASAYTYNGLVVYLTSGGALELLVQHGEIFWAEPVAPSRAWAKRPAKGVALPMVSYTPEVLDVPSTVGERVPE